MPRDKRKLKKSARAKQTREAMSRWRARIGPLAAELGKAQAGASYHTRKAQLVSAKIAEIKRQIGPIAT